MSEDICRKHGVWHCLDCGYHWMTADELLTELGAS